MMPRPVIASWRAAVAMLAGLAPVPALADISAPPIGSLAQTAPPVENPRPVAAKRVKLRNPVIAKNTTWKDQDVSITGTLTIQGSATLTIVNCKVDFLVEVEDANSWVMKGASVVVAKNSDFRSGDRFDRQWNLEAYDRASVSFDNATLTNHTGLRFHDRSRLDARASNVEEVQLHDNAGIRLRDRSIAYVVLFFGQDIRADLTRASLKAGDAHQTQALRVPTGKDAKGAAKVGSLDIQNAAVIGWQLDASDQATVKFKNGQHVVLAPHVEGDFAKVISDDITGQKRNGSLDFSKEGGPRYDFANSHIEMLNLYLDENVRLELKGATVVNEPNVAGTSKLTLGNRVTLFANLAQTYDRGQMIMNGTRLAVDGDEGTPSITAIDQSIIRLNQVKVTKPTHVFTVGASQVHIYGGGPWDRKLFEETDKEPPGGIYVH